ncbi:MAG: FliO/MopB family protein [Pirellulales bacterium]
MHINRWALLTICIATSSICIAQAEPLGAPPLRAPSSISSTTPQVSNQPVSVAPSFYASNTTLDRSPALPVVQNKQILPLQADLAKQPAKAGLQLPQKSNPLALPKRSSDTSKSTDSSFKIAPLNTSGIVASLLVVVGLFLIVAWIGKKNMPRSMMRLPTEVVQVLGKAQLSGKQQLQLVRVGNRLILLSITPHGAETLTEINDPKEVESLMVQCKQESTGSASVNFNQLLHDMGSQPTKGFLEA